MERRVRWKVIYSCWFAPEYPNPNVNNVKGKVVFTANQKVSLPQGIKKDEHFLQAQWYIRLKDLLFFQYMATNNKEQLREAVQ